MKFLLSFSKARMAASICHALVLSNPNYLNENLNYLSFYCSTSFLKNYHSNSKI